MLDERDNSPRCTAGTNDVLVGDGGEVTLLDDEFLVGRDDMHHALLANDIGAQRNGRSATVGDSRASSAIRKLTLIMLSLLGELGEVDGVLTRFRYLQGKGSEDCRKAIDCEP